MSIDKIKQEVALIPLAKLNAVIASRGQAERQNKKDAVADVVALIASGLLTVDDVRRAVPTAHQVVDSASQDAVWERISEVAATIKELDTEVADKFDLVDQILKVVKADIRSAAHPVIDSAQIAKAVAEQVGEAFSAFKQSATTEQISAVASTVPVFSSRKASELFPVTSYNLNDRLVDFGSLEVGVWGDASAPSVVDDYVFDPAHLHQALVALDDPLPDNVWLAGERGTGKTEFVTQLAARLGRKLFRVNFDEALERADFIGSNTIEDSNVVWKAGIIAQAIQYPGALILLDEVGFARAQSISVLHSLTERSVHRALTVPETGHRIPVAQYVSFFAADNSNGHGDASGNFAGVRDQNTAFLDRFGYTLEFDYLPADKEANLLVTRTGIKQDQADALVYFANVAREKARGGLLTQPPSLRQLFALCRAVAKGIPVLQAFKSTIINKFPADCAPELTGVFTASVPLDLFGG